MSITEIESNGEAVRELNALDRCDVCGAQAYVSVELSTGELLFCGHHASQMKEALQTVAIKWHDETSKLQAKAE